MYKEKTVTDYINNILSFFDRNMDFIMNVTIIIRKNNLLDTYSELYLWAIANKYFYSYYDFTEGFSRKDKQMEKDFLEFLKVVSFKLESGIEVNI